MRDTNWTKWSSIAEIVSSITVLLTLVYLALQTNQISEQTEILAEQSRQNTEAIRSASRQEVLNAELWLLDKIIENPELELGGFIFDFAGMDDNQSRQQANLYNAFFRTRENLWNQYNNKVLDEATWLSYKRTLVFVLGLESNMKSYWEFMTSRGALNSDFVEEINSELNQN